MVVPTATVIHCWTHNAQGRADVNGGASPSPFIPANPQVRFAVRRSVHCPIDRRSFFFSFEFSVFYYRVNPHSS
jgi:hypothetical protein